MRTLLCLIVLLTTLQTARGQQADAPGGPQLIPALPDNSSETLAPIRQARLPRVEPTLVVPATALPDADAVRRADHVEPAGLPSACRCDRTGRALTIDWGSGFGVSLGECSKRSADDCCCGSKWAQWCLDRLASCLGSGEQVQPLPISAKDKCACSTDCGCKDKCQCSTDSRCNNNCRCGASQQAQTESAAPATADVPPPCGQLCHVETAGGNYFGRLRSLTADWVVLDDEPNDISHWIPRTTLICLSTYPENETEIEAAEEGGKPDELTSRSPQVDRAACNQRAVYNDTRTTYADPQVESLPLHSKVVYSQHAAGDDEAECQFRKTGEQPSVEVPHGMRLMVLGFPWNQVMQLEPGDRIDLITVLTVQTASGYPQKVARTFAQNVQVANIEPVEGVDAVLSVLLTPEQCDLAAVAAVSGPIMYSKRNPDEAVSDRESKGATLRRLLGSAIDELDMGEQSPVFAISPFEPPPRPAMPMMGAPAPFAMPGPVAWPHPGEFGPGMVGPPPMPGAGCGPECLGPAAGIPPFAAVPQGFMPPGPAGAGPMPFGPPPAMPTFAPAIPAPELPPHDHEAPRFEPGHPTAPGLPAPKTVYLPDPPAAGKGTKGSKSPISKPEQVAPEFEPIKPAASKPLKTSQALPGGRMIRPLAYDAAMLPPPPVPSTDGAVQQAAATLPAVPATASQKPRYQLECVVQMSVGSQKRTLTETTVETADEATATIGELEFKFRVELLERRDVQLTFRDPMGILQVVRAREGESLTLPWRSQTADHHGDVRVTVVRVQKPAGEVAAAVYQAPAKRTDDYDVRLYDAADLLGARAPAVPVLARSLYARKLLDDGPASSDEAHAALMNLIRSVAPDSWQPQGEASVQYLPESMSLVIRQAPENHERIAELFDQLRAQEPTANARTSVRPASAKSNTPQSSRRDAQR